MKRIWLSWALALVLALGLVAPVSAGGLQDGKVIFGGEYTLHSGETLNGDLAVFGGTVTVEAGAVVNGNLAVVGGTVTVAGEIHGDVAVVGGTASLLSGALVSGDLVTVGGSVSRAADAVVQGDIVENPSGSVTLPVMSDGRWNWENVPPIGGEEQHTLWGLKALWGLLQALAMSGLAMLLVLFLPQPLERVRRAAVAQPLPAGGLGLLAAVLVPGGMIVLALTLILIPVSLLAGLALVVAVFFGWLALGVEVGRRLAEALQQPWTPLVQAAIGTFFLEILTTLLDWVPCVGWIPRVALGLLGLGAVLATYFGTRTWPLDAGSELVPAGAAPEEIPPVG